MGTFDSDKHDNKSILFIDAKPDTLVNLYHYFKPYYNCYFATTGKAGLILFKSRKPSVVVCDIDFPDISGFDLCRQLKLAHQKLCFIFLSYQNNKAIRMKGLECLADTFIDKNLDDNEIFLRIRNLHPCNNFSDSLGDMGICDTAFNHTQNLKTRLYSLFSQHYSVSDTKKANINMCNISSELALSVRSLQRKLKEETSLSFTQHHLLFRLEKAEQLLLQGYSSTEIADKLNFTSSAYFACCFKKHYKMTPSQFKHGIFS